MSASRRMLDRLTSEMPLPSITPSGMAGLTALLEAPELAVVALDFDGTLADVVADPAQARLRPGVGYALTRLSHRLAHVAIVTGRPLRDLEGPQGSFQTSQLKRLHLLGLYGAESWDPVASQRHVATPSPALERARNLLPALLEQCGADAGVRVEDKGAAFAVHTRRAADPQAAFQRLRPVLSHLADQHGLKAELGRLVIELRADGQDKGGALSGFLTRHEARTVLYAGDDLGDIPAFDAVAHHRSTGGSGTLLYSAPPGDGERVPELARRADACVAGPHGMARLLLLLAEALDRKARRRAAAAQPRRAST